jgi:hypothetical protein
MPTVIDWIQVTGSILGLILGTLSGSLLYNTIFAPNIIIHNPQFSKNRNNAIIDITNNGSAPAKNALIVVRSNESFINNPTFFATDSYSSLTNLTNEPNVLELSVPKFSQGEGSIVQINASLHHQINTPPANLTVYTTYDEGSKKYPSTMLSYQNLLLPIAFAFAAIASFTGPYIYQWSRSRRRNFATRILFDFVHINHRFLIQGEKLDTEPIVKPDLMGYKLWKGYHELTRKRLLRIDKKFFVDTKFEKDLKGKNQDHDEYYYFDLINQAYEDIVKREMVLGPNKDDNVLKTKNTGIKEKSSEIVTTIRWDVYGI